MLSRGTLSEPERSVPVDDFLFRVSCFVRRAAEDPRSPSQLPKARATAPTLVKERYSRSCRIYAPDFLAARERDTRVLRVADRSCLVNTDPVNVNTPFYRPHFRNRTEQKRYGRFSEGTVVHVVSEASLYIHRRSAVSLRYGCCGHGADASLNVKSGFCACAVRCGKTRACL